uniref:Ras-associating domain-containing protein n=1 Tax=Steinernema glaseri TaxID=37863 RepID=A0A1I7ZCU9_9BILA
MPNFPDKRKFKTACLFDFPLFSSPATLARSDDKDPKPSALTTSGDSHQWERSLIVRTSLDIDDSVDHLLELSRCAEHHAVQNISPGTYRLRFDDVDTVIAVLRSLQSEENALQGVSIRRDWPPTEMDKRTAAEQKANWLNMHGANPRYYVDEVDLTVKQYAKPKLISRNLLIEGRLPEDPDDDCEFAAHFVEQLHLPAESIFSTRRLADSLLRVVFLNREAAVQVLHELQELGGVAGYSVCREWSREMMKTRTETLERCARLGGDFYVDEVDLSLREYRG